MLVRLLYASRAADTVDADALHAIVRASRTHNAAAGITGVLCLCLTNRIFLQALEGGRAEVNRLYGRILRDARHRDVELLSYGEIGERLFAGWSMGQVEMTRLNPATVLKYSPMPTLDPYRGSGAAQLALLQELMATAAVMGH